MVGIVKAIFEKQLNDVYGTDDEFKTYLAYEHNDHFLNFPYLYDHIFEKMQLSDTAGNRIVNKILNGDQLTSYEVVCVHYGKIHKELLNIIENKVFYIDIMGYQEAIYYCVFKITSDERFFETECKGSCFESQVAHEVSLKKYGGIEFWGRS